jgi:hypothetical protein
VFVRIGERRNGHEPVGEGGCNVLIHQVVGTLCRLAEEGLTLGTKRIPQFFLAPINLVFMRVQL